jgi:hypothetical protein
MIIHRLQNIKIKRIKRSVGVRNKRSQLNSRRLAQRWPIRPTSKKNRDREMKRLPEAKGDLMKSTRSVPSTAKSAYLN